MDGEPIGPAGGIGQPARISFPLLMAVLIAAELACSLELNMIWVILSKLYAEYGDPVRVGWLVTGFTLVAAGSAAICGRLGDMFGRRRVMLIVLLIATCGSLVSASSHDLNLIIAGRSIQGISMAILPLCFGILREHGPVEKLPFGVGVLGGVYAFGSSISGVIGGMLVDGGHWKYVFYLSAAATLFAAFLVLMLIPRSVIRKAPAKIDAIGGLLFVPSIAAILLAFTFSRDTGWTSPLPVSLLLGGIAGSALWVWHERRLDDPLIDVRLLRNRQIALSNLCIFLTGLGPMAQALITLPLLQQPVWTGVGFGLSATAAAMLKLPGGAMSVAASTLAGRLAVRIGMRQVVIGVCVMNVLAWLALTLFHGRIETVMAIAILFVMPGAALIAGCVPALVMEEAPEHRTSEATGLCQVVRSLGLTIGSQVVAYLLAVDVVSDSARGTGAFPSAHAYTLACAGITFFAALAMLAAFMVPGKAVPARAVLA